MNPKRLLTLVALLSVLVSSVAFAAPAMAGVEEDPANVAAEICRELDEEGILGTGDFTGENRGKCVHFFMGPSSQNANNFIAALCGLDLGQLITGTTSKGECIKFARTLND